MLLAAACTSVSSLAGVASCPPASDCPSCPACPAPRPSSLEARYEAVAWTDIPGWRDVTLAHSLRAFLVGCAKLGSAGARQLICERAGDVSTEEEGGGRGFFEFEFTPYRVVSPEQSDRGLVTRDLQPAVPARP